MGLKIKKQATPAKAQAVAPLAESNQEEVGAPWEGSVSVSHKDGSETAVYETVEHEAEELQADETAYISVGIGATRNTGNFESMKFYVGIVLPCKATAEEIEETYAQARAWVDDKVSATNEEIDQGIINSK